MTLDIAYDLLNFYINKYQGAYFTMAELDNIVDRSQNALYKTYYDEYGLSQRLDDALAPFKVDFQFTNGTTPAGLITTPTDYLNLLSLHTVVMGTDNVARRRPVQIMSEEAIDNRLNSQVVTVTVNDPVGVIKQNWNIQLYPAQPQAGSMSYLRLPVAPYFAYFTVSGRVIVYDPLLSVQLEWSEQDTNSILIIALSYLGINIGEQDILQFAEQKNQQNIMSKMKQ